MTATPSVVERIKKLLALAADKNNEHESALAASRVQDLLQEHNLSMAEIASASSSRATSDIPGGKREKIKHTKSAMYKYQRDLMKALARNNFCMHWMSKTDKMDGKKQRYVDCHVLLGREENIMATQMTYDYLVYAMDRLLPYQGMQKRGKEALLWLAGCTERLVERLDQQRRQKERESAQAHTHEEASTAIVLASVYSTENDFNEDARYGMEPGTTASRRRQNEMRWEEENRRQQELVDKGHSLHEAWYLARGMTVPVTIEEEIKPETEAQRRKREEKETREEKRYEERSNRRWWKDQERRDHPAFKQGRAKGEDIGLNIQIDDTKARRIG